LGGQWGQGERINSEAKRGNKKERTKKKNEPKPLRNGHIDGSWTSGALIHQSRQPELNQLSGGKKKT